MPEERFLTLHMHELLTYLGQQGVMTILVMAQHGLMGRMESPVDVSYLSDTVLLLRYFEAAGHIRQARLGREEAHRPARADDPRDDDRAGRGHSRRAAADRVPGHPHRRADVHGPAAGKVGPLLKPQGESGGQGVP